MTNKNLWLASLFFLLFLSACTKETFETIENDINPTVSSTPEITLLGVNTNEVTEYTDSLVFTIEFLDGDGDLGSEDPDHATIELIDQRDPESLVFMYHLSPRAPDADIVIQGTIDIVLNNTIILDEANSSEATTFKIRIVDQAGNWSNEVETETITILSE